MRVPVLLQLLLVVGIRGYAWYQDALPNGGSVPHPCKANYLWHGVGHQNVQGGGARNPFGLDFAANGYKYDATLCQKDSDGDGLTNGAELGDPDCTWLVGALPSVTTGLSHPGVCEPIDSANCISRNNWDFCTQTEFVCNGTNDEDVKNVTLNFPKTAVPAIETSYYCMMFDFPSDTDYHIIATKPYLDNVNVMHHMLLYGCDGTANTSAMGYRTPQSCGMMARSSCGTLLAGWTVGSLGNCLDGIDAAIRIGNTTFKTALLEVHWNNPEKRSDWQDGSGMQIFYTPNLRANDLGVMAVGQMGLMIPPQTAAHDHTSVCSSSCLTSQVPQAMNVVSTVLHMHYLGNAGSLELYRNGQRVSYLANDVVFRYDSPVDHAHSPPVPILPGDELRLKCSYKSTSRSSIVYYGDGTSDEMCFGFITYYPKLNFSSCVQFGQTEYCNNQGSTLVNGCEIGDETLIASLFYNVGVHCDATGVQCHAACAELLGPNAHACLRDDARYLLEFAAPNIGAGNLVLAMRSCDAYFLGISKAGGRLAPSVYVLLSVLVTILMAQVK